MKSADKKKIGAAWLRCFPSFSIVQPLRLFKRHGPVLLGICCDLTRQKDLYTPVAHYHFLALPLPVVSLSLAFRPLRRGVPIRLSAAEGPERVEELASLVAEGRPEFASPTLMLDTLVQRVAAMVKEDRFDLFSLRGLVATFAYLGHRESARHFADYVIPRDTEHWPEDVFGRHGGRQGFIDDLVKLGESGAVLHEVVRGQEAAHGVSALKDYELIVEAQE